MKLIKRFLSESREQWCFLGINILALIMAAIFEVSAPIYLGNIVDAIVNGLKNSENMEAILHVANNTILILIGLYSGHAICTYASEYIISGIAEKMVLKLRKQVSQQFYVVPISYFHSHNRGDLLSRLTSDLDNVAETLREGIPGLISSIIGIVGAVVMMIWISPLLASIIIGVIVLGITTLSVMAKRTRTVYLRNQEALGAFNGGVEELVTGKAVVQAFGLEQVTTNQLDELNSELFVRMRQSGFVGQLVMPLVNFINQISYVLVAIQGGLMVVRGTITLGDIQAFFLYVTQISDPISRSSYILTKLQETLAALGRIYEVIDVVPEADTGTVELQVPSRPSNCESSAGASVGETASSLTSDADALSQSNDAPSAFPITGAALPKTGAALPKTGVIEFNHVAFGYSPDKLLMKDLSLSIPAGSLVAIVGPTGAGKTTLVNLIMRFYEINSGSITIDGVNIQDLTRESLHKTVGMVLQDTWILTGTIADNIAYGKPNATREEIVNVASLAMADHFIRTLPNGYDTVLKNGASDLSQGQRQLITIARAFLANPSILILDEATANVDTRTEVEVQKAMEQLLQGRTSIVIAHRLSTIKDADFLLVVDNGDIIEQGTHEALMQRGGYYSELYKDYALGMSV